MTQMARAIAIAGAHRVAVGQVDHSTGAPRRSPRLLRLDDDVATRRVERRRPEHVPGLVADADALSFLDASEHVRVHLRAHEGVEARSRAGARRQSASPPPRPPGDDARSRRARDPGSGTFVSARAREPQVQGDEHDHPAHVVAELVRLRHDRDDGGEHRETRRAARASRDRSLRAAATRGAPGSPPRTRRRIPPSGCRSSRRASTGRRSTCSSVSGRIPISRSEQAKRTGRGAPASQGGDDE